MKSVLTIWVSHLSWREISPRAPTVRSRMRSKSTSKPTFLKKKTVNMEQLFLVIKGGDFKSIILYSFTREWKSRFPRKKLQIPWKKPGTPYAARTIQAGWFETTQQKADYGDDGANWANYSPFILCPLKSKLHYHLLYKKKLWNTLIGDYNVHKCPGRLLGKPLPIHWWKGQSITWSTVHGKPLMNSKTRTGAQVIWGFEPSYTDVICIVSVLRYSKQHVEKSIEDLNW